MTISIQPITGRRLRVAIVGCGRISRNHVRAISLNYNRAEIVAVCDSDAQSLANIKDLILDGSSGDFPGTSSIPDAFLSYEDLLYAVKTNCIAIDLVVLTTPSGLHSAQAISAADLNLHVCSEKPMATTWNDGLAMVKACESAGVHLFVVKQNRFNSTLQLLKKQLESDRFGRLAMIAVNVFWHRPQSYYDQATWRGTWKFDGGALMNQASHYVDLLTWLFGPVISLSASTATIARNIEAEDTAAIQLKFRNGALGTMAVTMLTYPKNLEGSITILGENGTVKIGGPAVNQIEHWSFADQSPDDSLIEQASYGTTSVYGLGHPPFYENIFDALQGKSRPLCDGREGLNSLELLIGSYRSAQNNCVVNFPLEA